MRTTRCPPKPRPILPSHPTLYRSSVPYGSCDRAGAGAAATDGPPAARVALATIERYLSLRATRLGERTIDAYRRDLVRFVLALATAPGAPPVRGSLLSAVTPEQVAEYLRARFREPGRPDDRRAWSVRTAHRVRAILHAFFAWAHRAGLVPANPVSEVQLPRVERARPRVVPATAIEQLFVYVERRITELTDTDPRRAALYVLDAAVLRLLDRLALRVSEATTLRLTDLLVGTRPDGAMEVRAWVRKKGHKPKEYPVCGIVLRAYHRWLAVRRTVEPLPGHEDALFVHPWTGHRVSRQRAWHRLRQLAKEAGLSHEVRRHLSPHQLRHTRARRMLDEGWDLAAVQSVLDHANIATTSVYLADDERERLRTLRALSE
jgi:site-specific recombinase XerD